MSSRCLEVTKIDSLLIVAGVAFVLGGINDWLDFAIFRIFEHRNWLTHSLISPILIIGVVFGITSVVFSWFWVLLLSSIFSLSWILHVLLDSLTPTAIYLFSVKRVVKGNIHYKNLQWNLFFIGIGKSILLFGETIEKEYKRKGVLKQMIGLFATWKAQNGITHGEMPIGEDNSGSIHMAKSYGGSQNRSHVLMKLKL